MVMNLIWSVISVVILYIIIALLWQVAEKVFYGVITHRGIDDVIAIILAMSIYLNIVYIFADK